jgi:hypothetical protein
VSAYRKFSELSETEKATGRPGAATFPRTGTAMPAASATFATFAAPPVESRSPPSGSVDDFDEKAAILEYDGAVPRDKAELRAKRAPAIACPWPTEAWQQIYRLKLAYWRARRRKADGSSTIYTAAEAARLAYAEAQRLWHRRHGELVDLGLCAGCDQPLNRDKAIHAGDGNETHADNACLIAYGRRWRGAARQALEALGVPAPADDQAEDRAKHL